MSQEFALEVSPEIGKVSASYIKADTPVCLMVMAHGAGAGMNHPFMINLANALAENNISTLRFNFPFLENKKGRPDPTQDDCHDYTTRKRKISFGSTFAFG
jgi:predicted alpha/beta-hydrolase family hydrolase